MARDCCSGRGGIRPVGEAFQSVGARPVMECFYQCASKRKFAILFEHSKTGKFVVSRVCFGDFDASDCANGRD